MNYRDKLLRNDIKKLKAQEEALVNTLKEKIKDLEKQLLELAKQRIKEKKELAKKIKEKDQQIEKQKEREESEARLEAKLKKLQNEQLRAINVLFDEKAKHYGTIDFNGLYSLLKGISEREREREQTSRNNPHLQQVEKEKEITLDYSLQLEQTIKEFQTKLTQNINS
jgi:hypothetical protein